MNVYSNPEHFGLTLLGEVEWDDWGYSFNLTAVWRDSAGKLYWGDDGGCSCPSPFEDFTSLDDLTTGTVMELQAHLDERLENARGNPAGEIAELMLRVTS